MASTKRTTARRPRGGGPPRGDARPAAGTRPRSAAAEITVRMYRTGLGDCFLLRFPRPGQRPFHMLVDCGVFYRTPNEKSRMQRIAAEIAGAVTVDGTPHLDLLVATHEHYDHLIGFKHARELFAKFTISEVWMAWPDKPGHPKAAWLRQIEDKLRAGLAMALRDARRDPRLAGRARAVESLLAFGVQRLGARYSEQLGEVKRWLREGTGAAVDYLEPHGKPRKLGDVPDARVYVLGPPLEPKRLRKMNDSKSDPETYHLPLSAVPAFVRLAGERGTRAERDDLESLTMPFDSHWQVKERGAYRDRRTADFLAEHYPPGPGHAWRRISNDWMTAVEELALQLDSLTNNSSLALAIEVGRSRRVILLAADAQVGNWLSWHDAGWEVRLPGSGRQTVTAEELLRRTVLYKVGHHGSHNATLKQRGLELMTSDELVAMIPVNEKFARDVQGWQMPFRPLLKDLKSRTRGRVMRADTGLPGKAAVAGSVRTAFFRRATETDWYVEYRIPVD